MLVRFSDYSILYVAAAVVVVVVYTSLLAYTQWASDVCRCECVCFYIAGQFSLLHGVYYALHDGFGSIYCPAWPHFSLKIILKNSMTAVCVSEHLPCTETNAQQQHPMQHIGLPRAEWVKSGKDYNNNYCVNRQNCMRGNGGVEKKRRKQTFRGRNEGKCRRK